jgi:hypothetical protein
MLDTDEFKSLHCILRFYEYYCFPGAQTRMTLTGFGVLGSAYKSHFLHQLLNDLSEFPIPCKPYLVPLFLSEDNILPAV